MRSSLRGGIPTALVVPVVERYMTEHDMTLDTFAEHVGSGWNRMQRLLSQEYITTEFDFADRLLCKMNLVHLWWEPPLAEHYDAADIAAPSKTSTYPEDRCQRPGCTNTFEPKPHTPGGRQRFCSETCRKHEADLRRGLIETPLLFVSQYECPQGHQRGPDNPPGPCRECRREYNRLYYEKNAERLKAAERERYRKRTAA